MYLDKKMKELEMTMRAKCVTCSDPNATSQYATKPTECVIPYLSHYEVNQFEEIDKLIQKLKKDLEAKGESFGTTLNVTYIALDLKLNWSY